MDVYNDANNQVIEEGPRYVAGAPIDVTLQNDSLGRVVSQSVGNASLAGEYGTSAVTVEQSQYDGDGNLVLNTDADLNETKYVYDGANRQIQVIQGYGSSVQATTTYTYDKVGDTVSVKDARSHAAPSLTFPEDPNNPAPATFDIYYTYDALHRKVTETDGAGDTTSYTYDGDDDVTSMTNPRGNKTTYTYDELGALLSVDETAEGGGTTYYVYDANRNKIAQQDPNGNFVTYKYDKLNRLTDSYQFLTPGLLIAATTRSSLSGIAIYPSNPPATLAVHWHYGYDPNSNQNLVIDPKGQETHMTYDFRDRLATVTYTNAADPSLAYQPLTIDYTYDLDDNLTGVKETKTGPSGGTITEQYVYAFDALDCLTQSTRHEDLGAADDIVTYIGYTYDKQGNLKSETVPEANQLLPSGAPAPSTITTTYDYDSQNRLIAMHTGSGTTNYTYWPDGLVASVQYPNGVVADSSYADSYDAAGRLIDLVNHTGSVGLDPGAASSQFLSSFQYSYDPDSNRLAQTETHAWPTGLVIETTNYGYDKLDRLISVQYISVQNGINAALSYTYDNNGNRLTETGTDPTNNSQQVSLTYAYNRLNELMSVTDNITPSQSTAFTYDANGDRTQETIGQATTTTDANGNPVVTVGAIASVTPYFYNILDQLVKTTDHSNGGVVTFDYDYSGMRDKLIDAQEDTRYLYDGSGKLVLAYDGGTDQTIFKYNYGLTLVSTWDPTNGEVFYLFDLLGSTSELTNLSGTMVQGYQYDAWGNVIQSYGSSSNTVEFTGQLSDSVTGLDYYGARYYDPATGTFITQDTYLGEDDLPISLDRYVYAYANPLRYTDPTGNMCVGNSDTPCPSSQQASGGMQGPVAAAVSSNGANITFLTADDLNALQRMHNQAPPPPSNGVDPNTGIIYSNQEAVGQVSKGGAVGIDVISPASFFNMDVAYDGTAGLGANAAAGEFDFESYVAARIQEDHYGVPMSWNPKSASTPWDHTYQVAGRAANFTVKEVLPRAGGVAQVAFGVAQFIPAVLAAPETAGIGTILIGINAVDNIQAGARTAWSGDYVPTVLHQGVVATATTGLGASERDAEIGATLFELELASSISGAQKLTAGQAIKQFGLRNFATSGASVDEAMVIRRYCQQNGLVIGIRATDPVTAVGARVGSSMGLQAKMATVEAKSTFGFLRNPFNRTQWLRTDLDIAFMAKVNPETGELRYLMNSEVVSHLDPLNQAMRDSGVLGDPFQHGSHFTMMEQYGGPKSLESAMKIGSPGPVNIFTEGGMQTLNARGVYQYATRNMAPQMGVCRFTRGPRLNSVAATANDISGNATLITVNAANAMATLAQNVWQQALPATPTPTITVTLKNLPGSELGEADITALRFQRHAECRHHFPQPGCRGRRLVCRSHAAG